MISKADDRGMSVFQNEIFAENKTQYSEFFIGTREEVCWCGKYLQQDEQQLSNIELKQVIL